MPCVNRVNCIRNFNLERRHGELAGAEEEDDGGGHGERDERRDEVAGRRRRVVRVQRLVVVSR